MAKEDEKKDVSNSKGNRKASFLERIGLKILKIALAILLVFFILVGSIYVIEGDAVAGATETNDTYSTVVTDEGKVVNVKPVEEESEAQNGGGQAQAPGNPEEPNEKIVIDGKEYEVVETDTIAEELYEHLGDYISGTKEEALEKIKYLINAETVTKTPYIESSDPSLQGRIKFYRYTGEGEANSAYLNQGTENEQLDDKYRLTYKSPTDFNNLKNNYISSGDETVFNHFTLDNDGNVIIAYGSVEKRNITTQDEVDQEITLDMVKEFSGEEKYTGDYKEGFNMIEYSIFEKKIDYLSLAQEYVMPSNLLYIMLVSTRDISLIKSIAELAYNQEIAIGIYDNESHYEEGSTYTYNKLLNMNGEISLNLNDIKTTSPAITKNNLNSSPYNGQVPSKHKFQTNGEAGSYTLEKYDFNNNMTSTENFTGIKMYVSQVDANGKVASLGTQAEAKTFKIEYKKIIDAKSAPTVGVVLADTWMAKWKASFTREESQPSNSSNAGTNEDYESQQYENKDSVLNIFGEQLRRNIYQKVTTHAENMKAPAINYIVGKTNFKVTINPKILKVEDLKEEKRKELFLSHYDGCEECKNVIQQKFYFILPTSEAVFGYLNEQEDNRVKGTIVETHYKETLNTYVEGQNKQAKEDAKKESEKEEKKRKEKFTKELEEQIKSNYYILTGNKKYVGIAFTTASSRTSSKYVKSETVEIGDIGKGFSEVLNRTDNYESRKALIARADWTWFWENIQKTENTKDLENALRIILNVATGTTNFGTFTEEEIQNIFQVFKPKVEMQSTSMSGMKLLRDYIRVFELGAVFDYINGNSGYTSYVAKYISEDKTTYYIRDDGSGNPTVGFGVDIFNGGFAEQFYEMGYTDSQLRDISGAVEVPVEFVDSLEEQEIQANVTKIKQMTSHLNLENYQIYALVSRAYNCGLSGAMNGYKYSKINFVDSYTKYFNPETDIKYGETLGDFQHSLYTEFMDAPITSRTGVQPGLITRRKSEWTLFQTGYMDTLGKFVSSGDILTVADDVHTRQMSWVYYTDHPKGGSSLYWGNIEASINNPNESTCCATYVSTVIYEAGYASKEEMNAINYNLCVDLCRFLKSKGWTEITTKEELEPRRYSLYS